jgi:hypothetical protein
MKKHPVILLFLILLFVFLLIQFFRIDKSVPQSDPSMDFVVVKNPPRKITALIETSCYDCHSYKTKYPWYSNIAPVSWILKSHINKGRDHLNLSEYGNYSRERASLILFEMKEMVENGEMPLKSYTFIHRDALLNAEMKNALVKWLTSGKNDIQVP